MVPGGGHPRGHYRPKDIPDGAEADGAGIILVAVDVVDVPAALHGVADQQRFLVLDALGFRLLLIFVLLTQSCINRAKDSYTSFKA